MSVCVSDALRLRVRVFVFLFHTSHVRKLRLRVLYLACVKVFKQLANTIFDDKHCVKFEPSFQNMRSTISTHAMHTSGSDQNKVKSLAIKSFASVVIRLLLTCAKGRMTHPSTLSHQTSARILKQLI